MESDSSFEELDQAECSELRGIAGRMQALSATYHFVVEHTDEFTINKLNPQSFDTDEYLMHINSIDDHRRIIGDTVRRSLHDDQKTRIESIN